MIDRPAPSNLTAEQCALGCALIEMPAAHRLLELLSDADFYAERHRHIFAAISTIIGRGQALDPVTVSTELTRRGCYEECGGDLYLLALMDAPMTALLIDQYCRMVSEPATLRRLLSALAKAENMAYSGGDLDDVLCNVETEILGVRGRRVSEVRHISEGLDEEFARMEAVVTKKEPLGMKTGLPDLDFFVRLYGGDLNVIAARPSNGKTSLGIQIALNVVLQEDRPVLIFSMEMKLAQIAGRLLSMDARFDSHRLREALLGDDDWRHLAESHRRIGQSALYVDDTRRISMQEIRARSLRLASDRSLGLIVVDYLGLMRMSERKDGRHDLAIGEITASLKELAGELNAPILLLSQLSREVERGAERLPGLSDLKDSGCVEADADAVIFIHQPRKTDLKNIDKQERDGGPTKCALIVAKNRNGKTGVAPMLWHGRYVRFENIEERRDDCPER